MAKTLLEEIFNQITGRKSKPSRKHNYHNKSNRQVEKLLYQMKKNAFNVKRAYEDAQTRAYIKGWKK